MLTNTDLYQTDFAAWCAQTVTLLRLGQWDAIDMDALTEEIASLGRSDHRQLASRLETLVAHLLKWQYQPERRGSSWAKTIIEQRSRIARLLTNNRGVAETVPDVLSEIYPAARRLAIVEMAPGWAATFPRHGDMINTLYPRRLARGAMFEEATRALATVLPEVCPRCSERVLDVDFWPDPLP